MLPSPTDLATPMPNSKRVNYAMMRKMRDRRRRDNASGHANFDHDDVHPITRLTQAGPSYRGGFRSTGLYAAAPQVRTEHQTDIARDGSRSYGKSGIQGETDWRASMSGERGKSLPIPPPSPAFASTSSWTPTAASRPEHSAVAIPLESTTPLVPPPETPQVPAGPGFDEKYSAYGGADAAEPEREALLRRGEGYDDDDERRKGHHAVSPLDTLVRLLLGMFAILGFLVLLARLSVLPEHQTARVAAYMPSPVRGLIQVVEGPTEAHPIIPLLREAREKWHKKLTSQSRTFDRATRTYKARYGRAPPPGFDKWFAFATQGRNHSLVDEYDQLMADLEPFRALPAAELRRRTAELSKVPGISIVSIRNGEAQVHARSSSWAPADAFQRMLAAFVRDLPDMDIAINERPEGRVLPRQQRHVFMSDYGLEGDELVASKCLSVPFVVLGEPFRSRTPPCSQTCPTRSTARP